MLTQINKFCHLTSMYGSKVGALIPQVCVPKLERQAACSNSNIMHYVWNRPKRHFSQIIAKNVCIYTIRKQCQTVRTGFQRKSTRFVVISHRYTIPERFTKTLFLSRSIAADSLVLFVSSSSFFPFHFGFFFSPHLEMNNEKCSMEFVSSISAFFFSQIKWKHLLCILSSPQA